MAQPSTRDVEISRNGIEFQPSWVQMPLNVL
jgi:hypothetical protein